MNEKAKQHQEAYYLAKATTPQHADNAKRFIFKLKDCYGLKSMTERMKDDLVKLAELSDGLFTEELEDLQTLLCVELGSDKVKKLAKLFHME